MNRRVVCIRLPNWPIQRLLLARPALRDRAVVLHEDQRGAARVVACSPRVAGSGIAPGMTLAEATALVDESLLCREAHDPAADRRMLETLAGECERFSPCVGLEEVDQPENLFLDVASVSDWFGGEAVLVQRIVDQWVGRGLRAHVAVADTLGAAWAVAYISVRASTHPTIIPPGKTAEALAPLPAEALRLPAEAVSLLAALGIDVIGQLVALPRDALDWRLGPDVLRRLKQAIGEVDEPIATYRRVVAAAAEHTFEYPTAHPPALQSNLRWLLERLTGALRRTGEGITRFRCEFFLESRKKGTVSICAKHPPGRSGKRGPSPFATAGGPLRIDVGLYQASVSAGDLFELAWMQTERQVFSSPVATIRVEAIETAPLEYRQGDLFAQAARVPACRLARLIERLSGRLGHRAVLGVRLVADAQPERAYHYAPLIDRRAGMTGVAWPRRRGHAGASRKHAHASESMPRDGKAQPGKPAVAPGASRSLLLLPRPIALRLVSRGPDGNPLCFEQHGRAHRVAGFWGPERIETGWWRGRGVGRDYYRVETPEGRRLWLFHRLRDGAWFLHGRFQ